MNRKNSVPTALDITIANSKATGNNEVVHLLNELKSFLYFLFSLLSLHYSCCRGKKKTHKMSLYRSHWQLSSTVFCVCLNSLLTKCSRPDAQNTEVHDLSTQQTKDSQQLTSLYLLFLTCHCQDTQAKRSRFNLSSKLKTPGK